VSRLSSGPPEEDAVVWDPLRLIYFDRTSLVQEPL
jgi:hypothetical protein